MGPVYEATDAFQALLVKGFLSAYLAPLAGQLGQGTASTRSTRDKNCTHTADFLLVALAVV